jgi:hypothetical protein
MKRLAYAVLGLGCGRYAIANWVTPACLSAVTNACTLTMMSRRAPFLGLALLGGMVFLFSAVLPAGDLRDSFSEAADWVLAAGATVAGLALTVAAAHAIGPWGLLLPALLLAALPFLLRKALRLLSRA